MHEDKPDAAFARQVCDGLAASPKRLPSVYFYDDTGSRLFEQIMQLPEYYLSRAEARLLDRQGPALAAHLAEHGRALKLIELGSGNGEKTLLLCQALAALTPHWRYCPIDQSRPALAALRQRFQRALPGAAVQPLLGDYCEVWPDGDAAERQVVLLMGSNLGNLTEPQAIELLRAVRGHLHAGDRLLLGLDLQKDPRVILRAYDDALGLTARFNLNLLARMNRELAMDFDLGAFHHYATYSPLDGAARSFLVSRRRQRVTSRFLARHFDFEAGETIYTEQSQKYTEPMVQGLVAAAGFTVDANFIDAQDRYAVFVCGVAGVPT